MRRFFVETIEESGGACIIRGPEARHIATVLRMRPGDRLILQDRKGSRFEVRITSAGAREVRVALERPLPSPPAPPIEITLCQALLKSQAMDYVVQKTSELGVMDISPFTSERTVARVEGERASARLRHWREVARYAATQSDRHVPAEIDPVCSLQETLARYAPEDAHKLILWEQEDSEDLRGHLKRLLPVKRFIAVVGPEGGFSSPEIASAGRAGFESVSMGRRVLRAETAAIALIAILQYEWGDLSRQGTRCKI